MGAVETVVNALRQGGFRAETAYPGKKFPHITQPAAAVHLSKADGDSLTVEVLMVCPAALGGAACENQALQAAKVLRQAGAVCSLSGCRYDGAAQVYVTSLLAVFTETGTEEGEAGFTVAINRVVRPYALAFTGEEISGCQTEHVIGEAAPAGVSWGRKHWKIQLEEKIPAGMPEPAEPAGVFEIRVETPLKTEIYTGCGWTSICRERTGEGLRRICKGVAAMRKEEANG